MFDDETELDDHRSPAEPDALKDVDIKSGTGDPEAVMDQKGEAKEASDTTPQEAGSL